MVEPQIVVLVVAGSSPVGHPSFGKLEIRSSKFETDLSCRAVAFSEGGRHLGFRVWNLESPPLGGGGITAAKEVDMTSTTIDFFGQSQFRAAAPNFWERIINDEQLKDCSDLEKLIVGCEMIAALDRVELLLAA